MTRIDPQAHAELKREIVGVYDRASSLYDRVGIRQFTYYACLLIEALDIPPGAHVLDAATGSGALLFPAAESFYESSDITLTFASLSVWEYHEKRLRAQLPHDILESDGKLEKGLLWMRSLKKG